jgi:hypothetical protein
VGPIADINLTAVETFHYTSDVTFMIKQIKTNGQLGDQLDPDLCITDLSFVLASQL